MRIIWLGVLAIAVAACGGDGDGAAVAPGTSTTTASYDAMTATAAQRLEQFKLLLGRRGIPSETSDVEAATVAANVCDNDVAGMRQLLSFAELIAESEADMTQFASEKVTLIDAYCPAQRLQFEAALADHPGVAIPRAND